MFKPLAASSLVLATLVLALGESPARQADLVEASVFAVPINEGMGCRITVKARNGDAREDIWLRSEDSRVRSKIVIPGIKLKTVWGTWKKPLPMSNRRIRPGELATVSMELDWNCNSPRQYEFIFKKSANTVNVCYGGDSGTTRQDVPLSDVNRYFTYGERPCS